MRTNTRITKINQEMKRELSNIIDNELKDPRIKEAMTSVTNVETTTDLKHCKVFVSILGNDEVKKDILVGLKSAAGFIRKEIASRINLRVTPEFTFKIDESIEHSIHMSELFKKINE
ncbi:MAG TPA: 30S ribosome-binding factor RbfA [Clostridiales bacterium]|nr:MAG: ribosome-binding factor A [Clostridiales bacterium GWD2_32_19]HCC07093.1 30S ribosome-binding factor RbfA [Clostridiales bacterium]